MEALAQNVSFYTPVEENPDLVRTGLAIRLREICVHYHWTDLAPRFSQRTVSSLAETWARCLSNHAVCSARTPYTSRGFLLPLLPSNPCLTPPFASQSLYLFYLYHSPHPSFPIPSLPRFTAQAQVCGIPHLIPREIHYSGLAGSNRHTVPKIKIFTCHRLAYN